MEPRERKLNCARARVLLEAFVDGELAAPRRRGLEAHLAACAACTTELAHARRVRTALRDLPRQQAPQGVMPAVLHRIEAEAAAPPAAARVVDLRAWRTRLWRPALVAASIAAVLAAVMILSRPRVHETSPEDVARAELQAKWVIAQLSAIGRATEHTVRKDVIQDRVLVPAAHAVESVGDAQAH